MLGNCAHCHNPKGFTSVSAPVLTDMVNFYPNAEGGGIFEFPLDRVSPRIQRKYVTSTHEVMTVNMPYITPAIYDTPRGSQPDLGNLEDPQARLANAAPWRSLIYRNVSTPFTYSGDQALYPHMPMNTPGFDCRVSRIMAEWMLSIPALPTAGAADGPRDPQDQPFVEVRAGDSGYSKAFRVAEQHLAAYRSGARYEYCPDTRDIVDSDVKPPEKPVPDAKTFGIPERPHWVVTDLTDPPGAWVPRNVNWYSTLAQGQVNLPESTDEEVEKKKDQESLIALLPALRLTDEFIDFAKKPVPFGLWKRKPGCDFSSVPNVGSFAGAERPEWFERNDDATSDAPVYMQSPGAAIFGMICVNCHGPQADSRGRQADTLVQLTGGGTRVANFRVGLFGPEDQPGANLLAEFSKAGSSTSEQYDWAARYMAWMALGGTSKVIPGAILNVVGANPVVGLPVDRGGVTSANMLSVARAVCRARLPDMSDLDSLGFNHDGRLAPHDGDKALPLQKNVVVKNGDAELWKKICTYENPMPVRAFAYLGQSGIQELGLQLTRLYRQAGYPADAPVMDHLGARAVGISTSNEAPWCVIRVPEPLGGNDPNWNAHMDAYYSGYGLAICPDALLVADATRAADEATGQHLGKYELSAADIRTWTQHGAVNAGMAVFTYLRELTQGRAQPVVEYDQCERLLQTETDRMCGAL
jgi:hypothetical protein